MPAAARDLRDTFSRGNPYFTHPAMRFRRGGRTRSTASSEGCHCRRFGAHATTGVACDARGCGGKRLLGLLSCERGPGAPLVPGKVRLPTLVDPTSPVNHVCAVRQ